MDDEAEEVVVEEDEDEDLSDALKSTASSTVLSVIDAASSTVSVSTDPPKSGTATKLHNCLSRLISVSHVLYVPKRQQ